MNESRIEIQLDRLKRITVKLCPIKRKVNSPPKSYFSFKTSSFQWFSIGVARCYTAVEINKFIPVVHAMHDGQDLRHPLLLLLSRILKNMSLLLFVLNKHQNGCDKTKNYAASD